MHDIFRYSLGLVIVFAWSFSFLGGYVCDTCPYWLSMNPCRGAATGQQSARLCPVFTVSSSSTIDNMCSYFLWRLCLRWRRNNCTHTAHSDPCTHVPYTSHLTVDIHQVSRRNKMHAETLRACWHLPPDSSQAAQFSCTKNTESHIRVSEFWHYELNPYVRQQWKCSLHGTSHFSKYLPSP